MIDRAAKRLAKEYLKKNDVLVIYLDGDMYVLGIVVRDAEWQAQIDAVNQDMDAKLHTIGWSNMLNRDTVTQATRKKINEIKGRLTVCPCWDIGKSYKEGKRWLQGFTAGIGYGRSPDNLLTALKSSKDKTITRTAPQNLVDFVNSQQGISYL